MKIDLGKNSIIYNVHFICESLEVSGDTNMEYIEKPSLRTRFAVFMFKLIMGVPLNKAIISHTLVKEKYNGTLKNESHKRANKKCEEALRRNDDNRSDA